MGKREKYFQICIDKLEITYTCTKEVKDVLSEGDVHKYSNGEFWLQRQKKPRFYKNEFVVWYQDFVVNATERGEEYMLCPKILGFLSFGSYNPNRQNVYLTFDNEALYTYSLVGARFYLEEAMNLRFKQISKLDLAVDFNFNIERRLIKIYKNTDYQLVINGRIADDKCVYNVGFLSFCNSRKRLFANPQMIAENDNKALQMKTYNKGKEIKESSRKFYIQEHFGSASTMYRIEMSAKNHKTIVKTLTKLKMSDEELYAQLDDEATLIYVFRHMLDRVIHIRKSRKPLNIIDEAIKDQQ